MLSGCSSNLYSFEFIEPRSWYTHSLVQISGQQGAGPATATAGSEPPPSLLLPDPKERLLLVRPAVESSVIWSWRKPSLTPTHPDINMERWNTANTICEPHPTTHHHQQNLKKNIFPLAHSAVRTKCLLRGREEKKERKRDRSRTRSNKRAAAGLRIIDRPA